MQEYNGESAYARVDGVSQVSLVFYQLLGKHGMSYGCLYINPFRKLLLSHSS